TITLLHAPTRAVFGAGAARSSALGASEAQTARLGAELPLLSYATLDEARTGSGVVAIASSPLGTLAVDGVELGVTPLAARRPIGRHLIEVTRLGFHPTQRWVDVGQETGEVRLA